MSGKKYTDALKGFDREQFYTPTEALGIVKTISKGGFDESVDVSVRLGVDPRKADQIVRGTVATISETDVEEIAKIKMPDLNANDLEAAKQQVRGTARSMGIAVS